MNYGLPYQGSKNAIAEWVIGQLPEAETFVDLFCGGCAITHAAMLSGKYKNFIANDIIGANPVLFKECAEGRHTIKSHMEWISREAFFSRKASENWLNLCYSFGNGGENYSYAQEIEPWRRALHFARVLGNREPLAKFGINSDGSREDIMAHAEEYKAKYISWYKTEVLKLSTSLEVEQERLTSGMDYQSVDIPGNAVIYCDIPYKDTDCAQYNGFDHERFYKWARDQKNIFISEYQMPEDFVELSSIRKLAMGFRAEAKEKLFTNKYTNETRSFAGVDLEFRQYSIFDLMS